jgi:hypothetical protein|tara:strand:+ start:2302 stop:2475 length:174 start_codon:yes stop_codon:yes gene_type:complete
MSNYPDDFPDHLLDEDMDGVDKLPCGCYEEACECPMCINCGEIVDDKETVCSECEEE